MSRTTSEGTAVTTRQRVGVALMLVFSALTAGVVLGATRTLSSRQEVTRSAEHLARLCAWSYGRSAHGASTFVYDAHPPALLWVGFVALFLSGCALRGRAIWVTGTKPRNSWRTRRSEWRGTYVRRGQISLSLGLGLLGVVLLVVCALRAPTSLTEAGLKNAQMGGAAILCLAGSGVALVCLVLMLPFGPREKVLVDPSGNARRVADLAVPPSVPPDSQPSAQPHTPEPAADTRQESRSS